MIEKTFFMIKPDAVGKNLIGAILQRIENAGLKIIAGKLILMQKIQAEKLYAEHKAKEFYQGLVDFALSGPAFVAVIEGENAVAKVREVNGATNPKKAVPGTIRYDFALGSELPANAVHGSDSAKSAEREILIFFKESEILTVK